MKKSLFYVTTIALLTSIFSISCKDKSSPTITKGDTTRVFALYADPSQADVLNGAMYRVITKGVDTSNQKLAWKIDTMYYKPTIDTLRDPTTRKPLTDSVGRFKTEVKWNFHPKQLVWDSGIRVDSVLSRFRQYLVADTTKKKPQ